MQLNCNGKPVDTSDSLIHCEKCGYIHVHPFPDAKTLTQLYAEDFYESDIPLYIKRYMQDIDWWKITYTQRLE